MNAYEQMRDALEMCARVIGENGIRRNVFLDDIQDAHKAVTAALALPRRQCDVGTAEEQSARYDEFCYQNRTIEHCCENCPVASSATCELAWSQLPYEEGGEK